MTEEAAPPDKQPEHRGPLATPSDILARLNSLSDKEYAMLLVYAKFYGKIVPDRDPGDILHEAILRALDGTRKWYPEAIHFKVFIIGCMKSIVCSWQKGAKNTEPPDELKSRIDEEAQREASFTINAIREHLCDHPHAVEIFDLMMVEGYTAREGQQRLGITKQDYEAAYKWMFRTLNSLKRKGYQQ